MSDPTGSSAGLTGQGELASQPSRLGEKLPESSVSGEVRYRGDESGRQVRFDEEQLNQLALQLAERMAAPKARWTFGELGARWLTRVKRVRLEDDQRNIVQLKPLWGLKEGELTPALISDWFGQLVAMGYSPVSVNKYRSAGKLAIAEAQANAQWGAANPFALVRRLREPKRKYELLTQDEARRVLPHFTPTYRRMFRVSMFLGLRPGELFALRKADVDFNKGIVHVRNSHGRNTTKTGKDRLLPLLAAVAGDLMDALRESPSELVFPNDKGGRRRADSKMCDRLRTAMGKAGITTGFAFTCRAPGCDWKMEFAGPCDDMRCPIHDWKAWRTPSVKPVRWYDARHMAASFHRLAGADRLAVKLLLGHSGDVTEDVYTHMGPDWLRAELSLFSL